MIFIINKWKIDSQHTIPFSKISVAANFLFLLIFYSHKWINSDAIGTAVVSSLSAALALVARFFFHSFLFPWAISCIRKSIEIELFYSLHSLLMRRDSWRLHIGRPRRCGERESLHAAKNIYYAVFSHIYPQLDSILQNIYIMYNVWQCISLRPIEWKTHTCI